MSPRGGGRAATLYHLPPVRRLLLAGVAGLLAVLAATPAGAATGAIAQGRPWHYWLAFVFVLSAAAVLVVALPVGYYLRVWRLRHRGR